MFESTKAFRERWLVLGIFLGTAAFPGRAVSDTHGQYRGDLAFLRQHHAAPQAPGESNHYFDLWNPGLLSAVMRDNGLTNNRCLLVDSHAFTQAGLVKGSHRFYPKANLLQPGQQTPYYSVRDLATVLGATNAGNIHNVVITGCNEEGGFRSQEVRRHFPNATNITYMASGHLAYKPMLYQALLRPSAEFTPLFGTETKHGDRTECRIVNKPVTGTKPLGTYVADLYRPGEMKPYRTQLAGRELLDPTAPPVGDLALRLTRPRGQGEKSSSKRSPLKTAPSLEGAQWAQLEVPVPSLTAN